MKFKMKALAAFCVVLIAITGCSKESMQSSYKYEVSGSAGDYSITCEGAPSRTVQYATGRNSQLFQAVDGRLRRAGQRPSNQGDG